MMKTNENVDGCTGEEVMKSKNYSDTKSGLNVYVSILLLVVLLLLFHETALASKSACEDWCFGSKGQSLGCDECDYGLNCDIGQIDLKSFTSGWNYTACRNYSNEQQCEDWCKGPEGSHLGCEKCSSGSNCVGALFWTATLCARNSKRAKQAQ